MEFEYWGLFCGLIIFFVILDLGVFHKRTKEPAMKESLLWSLVWILLACLFNVLVYFIYENGSFEKGSLMEQKSGMEAALQFFTGYVLEKSLSLDNLFVIFLIFSYYKIPLSLQQRVLTWGILSAACLRGAMIILGIALVHAFSWVLYLFGLILLITGIKLFFTQKIETINENNNLAIRLTSRFFPLLPELDGNRFFTKKNGFWQATPLLLALIHIETADVIFAIDSIPAIFAITLDPFIVFTSNIFAILGLRSLYFVLAPLIQKIRFLEQSLAVILAFIGAKMLFANYYHLPSWLSLLVVFAILACGILLSFLFPKKEKSRSSTPEEVDPQEILLSALRKGRKIVVLVVGGTVMLFGALLLFLPGPAFVIIPLGLAILSTEFVWARRFLRKLKGFIPNNLSKNK